MTKIGYFLLRNHDFVIHSFVSFLIPFLDKYATILSSILPHDIPKIANFQLLWRA